MQLSHWLVAVLSGAFACWLFVVFLGWVSTLVTTFELLSRQHGESRRRWLIRGAATLVGWLLLLIGGVLITYPLTNRYLNQSVGWRDALLAALGGASVVLAVRLIQPRVRRPR